jgi:5-methylcytosine-specific restriction endonuclease McrBC regulatory subunit McrC
MKIYQIDENQTVVFRVVQGVAHDVTSDDVTLTEGEFDCLTQLKSSVKALILHVSTDLRCGTFMFKDWVGVVCLSVRLTLEVRPKSMHHAVNLATLSRMHLDTATDDHLRAHYTCARDWQPLAEQDMADLAKGSSFRTELFMSIVVRFLAEAKRCLSDARISRAYVHQRQWSPFIVGRLEVGHSLSRHGAIAAPYAVTISRMSVNVPENQHVKNALAAVRRFLLTKARSDLLSDCKRHTRLLQLVNVIGDMRSRIVITSKNQHYSRLLLLCNLILSPTLTFRPQPSSIVSLFGFSTPDAFERYVRHLLNQGLCRDGFIVRKQHRPLSIVHHAGSNTFDIAPQVLDGKPDLCFLRSTSTLEQPLALVGDVKYAACEAVPDADWVQQVMAYGLCGQCDMIIICVRARQVCTFALASWTNRVSVTKIKDIQSPSNRNLHLVPLFTDETDDTDTLDAAARRLLQNVRKVLGLTITDAVMQ